MLGAGALAGDPARGRLKLNGSGTVAGRGDFEGDCARLVGGFGGGAEKTLGCRSSVVGGLTDEGLGALKTLEEREGFGGGKGGEGCEEQR